MAGTVLVCVTGQKSGEWLIRKGAQIACEHQASLLVLSVSGSGLNLTDNPQVMQSLNELYRISGEVGAEMTMLHHPDAPSTILPGIAALPTWFWGKAAPAQAASSPI